MRRAPAGPSSSASRSRPSAGWRSPGWDPRSRGAGLLAVAIALGWAIGLAVRSAAMTPAGAALAPRGRAALAACLAALGVAVGLGAPVGLVHGRRAGSLGPLDYLGERFGPLPIGMLALAVIAAALRAR